MAKTSRAKDVAAKELPPTAQPPGAPADRKGQIRNRIVGLKMIKASELIRNDKNFRLHPEGQRHALQSILKDIGFAGALVAREIDGSKYELIDGELRANIAADTEVPVLVVDLNDKEAARILATFDPLGGMAKVDEAGLRELLRGVEIDLDENAELRRVITDLHASLAKEERKADEEGGDEPADVPGMALEPHEHYDYLVVLATTAQEWNVICERLSLKPEKRRGRMGTCRAVRAEQLLAVLK